MKRKILISLHDYKPKMNKAIGKEIIISGDYKKRVGDRLDNFNGTLYGTLQSLDFDSITLNNCFDYHFPFSLQDEKEHERAITFFEHFRTLRTNMPLTLELTDKLQAYVIDLSE